MDAMKTIRLPANLHKELKLAAVEAGISLQEFLRRLLNSAGPDQKALKKNLLAELDSLAEDSPANRRRDLTDREIQAARQADRLDE